MLSPHQKLRIIVGGLVGQYPLGGVAWDYFHYVLGLHELGHEVYYHEDTWVWPYHPIRRYPTDDPAYTVSFIRDFFDAWAPELADRWHYLLLHERSFGMTRERFDQVAATADIFLNVSGANYIPEGLNPRCLKVFLDTDPGYNQIMLARRFSWSEFVDRWCASVAAHDRHLTYAENLYGPECVLPRVGLDWRPTRCVVTLPPWQALRHSPPPADAPFTTVMTWDYFRGKLDYEGIEYGAKVPEFERFMSLPQRTAAPLRLAIAGVKAPFDDLRRAGWNYVDAQAATLTPESYRQFIAGSLAEWSIAKNVYVAPRTGWFSCRTACYLAAGRPAVVQDTAWSRYIPAGQGLLAFSTMDQCLAGLDAVRSDFPQHSAAAYEIARQYLSPDKVLAPMIEAIYATSQAEAPRPPAIPRG